MAGNPACMNEDGNAAMFIGTNLQDGSSVTLCPSCLLQFCGVIVESMTGMPVNEMLLATSGEPSGETAQTEQPESDTSTSVEADESPESVEDASQSLPSDTDAD